MYSPLSCWRRGAKAWERKLIKWRNLSLKSHTYKMHTYGHVHAHTHTHTGHVLLMLSGMSSVYITYEFWHAAFLRVTKSAVFCVAIPRLPTWPHQACLGAGKQNHTHIRTHTHTHTRTLSCKCSPDICSVHLLLSSLTMC